MANREKGEVSFEHEGKTYTLVLNTMALAKLQVVFNTKDGQGRDVITEIEEIDRLVKAKSLIHCVALFWATLQKYHSVLVPTQDAAAELMDTAGAPAVAALLSVAGFGSPDPKDLEELAKGNPLTAQARRKKRGRGGSVSSLRSTAA